MWKFRDFSVTQILREINFEECRSSEIAIFAILGAALRFVNLVDFFSLQKVHKMHKNQTSEPLDLVKRQILRLCIRQL